MFRIRFHGRGGQGMKTSSRILGNAFFHQGYEVQDAPKYGAERRGAPMSAYVRAARKKIYERGIIHFPDIAVVADETLLVSIPEVIIEGLTSDAFILVNSRGNITEWKEKNNIKSTVAYIPVHPDFTDKEMTHHLLSTSCAAAAAALTGVISLLNLEKAIRDEHSALDDEAIKENIEAALYAFENIRSNNIQISEPDDADSHVFTDPGWIVMAPESSSLSAPAIHNTGNSFKNNTGSWRYLHPEIDKSKCSRCSICSIYCPDNAINTGDDLFPEIDYDHCKGCLICKAVCPKNAISIQKKNSIFKRSHYRGDI